MAHRIISDVKLPFSGNRGWRELGRAIATAWEWAVVLRPLALRALEKPGEKNDYEIPPDLHTIAGRISAFLDEQLGLLSPPDRFRLLAILHDQFATRLSA